MSTAVSEEVLNQMMAIARSYPKGEGITVEGLMDEHGFTDSGLLHAALKELERRGQLTARPLFFYAGGQLNK